MIRIPFVDNSSSHTRNENGERIKCQTIYFGCNKLILHYSRNIRDTLTDSSCGLDQTWSITVKGLPYDNPDSRLNTYHSLIHYSPTSLPGRRVRLLSIHSSGASIPVTSHFVVPPGPIPFTRSRTSRRFWYLPVKGSRIYVVF